ncbi:EF-hand domain-containing protein [Sphingomonas cavernae]|uniref:EF-hand domain-containing protein n=2 Tax=Sphingomonas cavernae TaxID=2320861 RepID=A0A418WLB0_9SPHN|nr:EF-hand domain-containing protein [Sphingomonas cavernae]
MTIVTLLLSTGVSEARKPPPIDPALLSAPTISATPAAVMIAGFDRDQDTRVTRAEFDAGLDRSFKHGDTNADAQISLIELSGWAQSWLGHSGALPGQYDFDRDGDDRVSRDEYRVEFNRRFAEMDKDKDGVLVRAELITLSSPRFQPRQPEKPPQKPNEGKKAR